MAGRAGPVDSVVLASFARSKAASKGGRTLQASLGGRVFFFHDDAAPTPPPTTTISPPSPATPRRSRRQRRFGGSGRRFERGGKAVGGEGVGCRVRAD